ncbi:MAG: hypothetical protein ACTSU9_07870 [Promethearchaeota archaeon]
MNQIDLNKQVEHIEDLLGSDDSSNKVSALRALTKMIEQDLLLKKQARVFVPVIHGILTGRSNSSIMEETIEAACALCDRFLQDCKTLLPLFQGILVLKNRFYSSLVLDFIVENGVIRDDEVKALVEYVLDHASVDFSDTFLKPKFDSFIESAISRDFRFIRRYRGALERAIAKDPGFFSGVAPAIKERISAYDSFLEEEARKREVRDQQRKEAAARAREAMEQAAQEPGGALDGGGSGDRGNGELPASVGIPAAPHDSRVPAGSGIQAGGDGCASTGVLDGGAGAVPGQEAHLNDHVDDGQFTTFSSLGLKRKEPDSEDEDAMDD